MENYELVSRALAYIDKQKSAPDITIEDVAREAGFSSDYFNRVFRNHTGYNVMEYVRFRRLVHAAMLLRKSERSVVDVGLACGYDSHDGFTRAFKKQYGKTPSEYRESLKDEPMCFADLQLNAAAGARVTHALPEFSVIPADMAIDYMLKTDSRRFGYDAICIDINGTIMLSDCDVDQKGCFIGADMFDHEGAYIYVHVKELSQLRSYVKRILKLLPRVIQIAVEENVSSEDIKLCLDGIKYNEISLIPHTMYFGDELPMSEARGKYVMRPLDEHDIGIVKAWARDMKIENGWDWGLCSTLAEPVEKRPDNQPLGLFDGEKLIGVSRTSIQQVRGFRINNCIYNAILPEYATDELYRLMYTLALNYVLGQDCIPFDDVQFGEFAKKNGNFTAFDIGYEQVNTVYIITF